MKVNVGLRDAASRLRPDISRRSPRATALHRRSLVLTRDLRSGFEGLLSRRSIDSLPVEADEPRPTPQPHAHRSAGARPAADAAHRVTLADRLAATRRARLALPAATHDGIRGRAESLLGGLGTRERAIPIAVASLVLVASVLSVAPVVGTPPTLQASDESPRLVVGGGVLAEGDEQVDGPAAGTGDAQPTEPPTLAAELGEDAAVPTGPYLADGTLLKPVAVDTTIPDARDKLVTYRVKAGDTLTGIANHYDVSMMTIWWANHLSAKDTLKVGQKLVIPPVNGLVVTVAAGDTLASIASKSGSDPEVIASYNELPDDTVVIGQTLIVPGALGAGIATPTPKPTTSSSSGSSSSHSSSGSSHGPTRYTGGKFLWPVPAGYISQYYHYGHWAIDIAAPYGSKIVAAAGGTVIFAGWKNNGGGYQVHVSDGGGIYTAYYHMSAITVRKGQSISRGTQVGRIGMTGWATGPHCHFEVWIGGIWGSGHRVNPLNYL